MSKYRHHKKTASKALRLVIAKHEQQVRDLVQGVVAGPNVCEHDLDLLASSAKTAGWCIGVWDALAAQEEEASNDA